MEEVSSGVRPIAAASTSTAAFVGLAEKGPDDEARRVTNWSQFRTHYGSFIPDSYLAQSVFQYFNNGGQQCYIVRITRSDAVTADITIANRAGTPVANGIRFSAKSKGGWGNYLVLQIEDGADDPGNTFKVSIRKQEEADVVPAGFGDTAALEVHDNLGVTPGAANFVEDVLASNSNLIDAQILNANTSLQNGFHRGGLGAAAPPGTINEPKFQVNIDGDGFRVVQIATGPLDLAATATAIQTAVQGMTALKVSTPAAAYTGFTCVVETVDTQDRLVLTSGTQSATSSVKVRNNPLDNAAAVLKLGEGYGGVSENGLAVRRPANADALQVGDNAVTAPVSAVTPGSDGVAVLGELDFSAGFSFLDNKTDFSLLAVPGIGTTTMVDEGMGYCRNRPLQDVFYIGEVGQEDELPSEAENFRKQLTQPNSYGAVYYPWIKAADASGQSQEPVLLPPSGYLAGLYARIDSSRGVWKAPAGTEASISGVVGLATDLTDVEQGNLNRINLNCLRRFAGAGIVSWGARTISSDPEWKYVPVRRMAIMLRVSIYNGIQWAVFEPNDEPLWRQLRLNLESFMMTLYRKGAFQGASPSDAYFVKCDSETTTQDDINLGVVNVLVGFAPLKPAEFVVVKISQKAGQAS
jgi:phage tail sheath protein FI